MDTFTQQHFSNWFERNFPYSDETETLREATRAKMVAEFEQDAEYWGNKTYWELYDHVLHVA